MYILGGHDIREGSLDSLWMLDLTKLQDLERPEDQQERKLMWHLIDMQGKDVPGPISHHSCSVFGDKLYLIGGTKFSGEQNTLIYVLDMKLYKWG